MTREAADLLARVEARRARDHEAGITHPAPTPTLARDVLDVLKPGSPT
ncbi:hypothetical protein [Gordonia iterans]|nr:hypothetical protein [Gordonia iterans]